MNQHSRMRAAAGALLLISIGAAFAETPASLERDYAALAQGEVVGFAGFSAARGDRLFHATQGNDSSCATCHTGNPLAIGRHAKTGKAIAPLAPAANAERFTDPAKSGFAAIATTSSAAPARRKRKATCWPI